MENNLKIKLLPLLFIFVFSTLGLKAQNITLSEGNFYRDDSNGKIYWCFVGKLRHVESIETFNGLFDNASNYVFHTNGISPNLIGDPLVLDNGLINDVNTGKVYFRRSNYIHYISSAEAFNTYHFSWAAITDVNGIGSYTPRGPLPINYVSSYQWSFNPTY
ncbi:hypothetical protein [Pedobacter sp. KACC 23697]|uniref:Uncharacterized protein n=1 Tax=Pedobacter sp. KACC 23697 TaxID=3149230 RepID=A0AAU7K2K3_9SPHI